MAKNFFYAGVVFHVLFILVSSSNSPNAITHTIISLIQFLLFLAIFGASLSFAWSKFKYHHITRYKAKFKDNIFGSLMIACIFYITLSLNNYLSFVDDLKKKYVVTQSVDSELQSSTPDSRSPNSQGPFGIALGENVKYYPHRRENNQEKNPCLLAGEKQVDFYSTYKVSPPRPYKARFSDYYALTNNTNQDIFSVIACQTYNSTTSEEECKQGVNAISLDLKIKYNINANKLMTAGFINLKDKLIEVSCIKQSNFKGKSYLALKYTHLESFVEAKKQSYEERIKQAKESSL